MFLYPGRSLSLKQTCYENQSSAIVAVLGTDYINYGEAGDPVGSHPEYWGLNTGNPIHTGINIEDTIPGTSQGIKSFAFDGDFEFEISINQIVFISPGSYGRMMVGAFSYFNTMWAYFEINNNWPYTQGIRAGRRGGSTTFASGAYNTTEMDMRFKFKRTSNDMKIAWWSRTLSAWQNVWNLGVHSSLKLVPAFNYYVGNTNPSYTAAVDEMIVYSGNMIPLYHRLGNHYYRTVYNSESDDIYEVDVSSGVGFTQNTNGISAWVTQISDPCFLTGGLQSSADNTWTLTASYTAIPNGSSWYAVLEVGYKDNSAFVNLGYESPRLNDHSFSKRNAVRIQHYRYSNRIIYQEFNNSGNEVSDNYTGIGGTNSGTFKIKHVGYNNFELYHNNTLYTTIQLDDWTMANHVNNDMYVMIATRSFNAQHNAVRWNYVTTTDNYCDNK